MRIFLFSFSHRRQKRCRPHKARGQWVNHQREEDDGGLHRKYTYPAPVRGQVKIPRLFFIPLLSIHHGRPKSASGTCRRRRAPRARHHPRRRGCCAWLRAYLLRCSFLCAPVWPSLLTLLQGLAPFVETLEDRRTMPYAAVPGLPAPSVVGHSGTLAAGFVPGRVRFPASLSRMAARGVGPIGRTDF